MTKLEEFENNDGGVQCLRIAPYLSYIEVYFRDESVRNRYLDNSMSSGENPLEEPYFLALTGKEEIGKLLSEIIKNKDIDAGCVKKLKEAFVQQAALFESESLFAKESRRK